MTGPGMLTKTIAEYLCSERKGKQESTKVGTEKDSNDDCGFTVIIFPYTVFNPIPNNYTVDLANVDEVKELKNKFLVNSVIRSENKNLEGDLNKWPDVYDNLIQEVDDMKHSLVSTTRSSNLDLVRGKKYFASAAIHWWQRSWQSEHTKEFSSSNVL